MVPYSQNLTPKTQAQLPTRYLRQAETADIEVILEDKAINNSFDVNTTPNNLGKLYIRNTYGNFGKFKSAARLNRVSFLLESLAAAENVDMTDFSVLINNVPRRVSSSGVITIDFGNERLLEGEVKDFDLAVSLYPQAALPAYSGSFRLSVTDLQVTKENTRENYEVSYLSDKSTANFAFGDLDSSLQSGNTVRFSMLPPGYDMLLGDDKTKIAELTVRPEFASLDIETLTLLSSGTVAADAVFDEIELRNATTNTFLDTATFNGNTATFRVAGNASILPINQDTKLEIYGITKETPAVGEISLTISPNEMELTSRSSGRTISSTDILVSGQPYQYFTSASTLQFAHSADQPASFLVDNNPQAVYKFTVNNPSNKDLYLSRMSFTPQLFGLDWEGGVLDDEDITIWQYGQGNYRYQTDWQPTIIGTEVRLDSTPAIIVNRNSELHFEIHLALNMTGATDDDAVAIYWNEDSLNLSDSNLGALQGSTARTIWRVDAERALWQSGNGLIFPTQGQKNFR